MRRGGNDSKDSRCVEGLELCSSGSDERYLEGILLLKILQDEPLACKHLQHLRHCLMVVLVLVSNEYE